MSFLCVSTSDGVCAEAVQNITEGRKKVKGSFPSSKLSTQLCVCCLRLRDWVLFFLERSVGQLDQKEKREKGKTSLSLSLSLRACDTWSLTCIHNVFLQLFKCSTTLVYCTFFFYSVTQIRAYRFIKIYLYTQMEVLITYKKSGGPLYTCFFFA